MYLTKIILIIIISPIAFFLSVSFTWTFLLDYFSSMVLPSPPISYDYIVVGAGSAGSVVAARLAESGAQVLLVEAGGPAPALAHIPAMVGSLQNSPIDWKFRTEKQEYASLAMGGVSSWPRGKVLGGSSILNYMMYVRGNRKDYDEWRDLGLEGWGYKDVLPFFKKSENFDSAVDKKNQYHGEGGDLTVTTNNHREPISDTFLNAGKELGYFVGDYNGEFQDSGFSETQVTMTNGLRSGTFKAFAEKFVGKNLTVLTHSHVNKVVMEGKTAVGVELSRFGQTKVFWAKKEVILSAGTIGSPHILMLSGIGDENHLEEVGITPVHNLPAVGRNLQDHLLVSLNLDVKDGFAVDVVAGLNPSTLTKYSQGKGPLSSNVCGGTAHVHTDINTDPRPDIQLHMISITLATDHGILVFDNFGALDKAWSWIEPHTQNTTAAITAILQRPFSKGFIKLRSTNPQDHPIIQPNYLTEQKDIDTLVSAMKLLLKISKTDAFKSAGAEPWGPDPFCQHHPFQSDEYWECYVKHFSITLYHPVGTCAMGTVLDQRLRVKGVAGLRVIDGSVMPKIVGGNTNAPIIMIAEKGSDMIIRDSVGKFENVNKDEYQKEEL